MKTRDDLEPECQSHFWRDMAVACVVSVIASLVTMWATNGAPF